MFWGISDIIDSIIADSDLPYLPNNINNMKYVFFKYVRKDIHNFLDILNQYHYPDIHNNEVASFCDALVKWVMHLDMCAESNSKEFINFDQLILECIIQLLNSCRNSKVLTFLNHNDEDVLMDSYDIFYIRPIYMFCNSIHIFDEEPQIQKKLRTDDIVINQKKLNNYKFVNSKDDKWIQISDAIVGILGKLFVYVNSSTEKNIHFDITNLNNHQFDNIRKLISLIKCSERISGKSFFHNIDRYAIDKADSFFTSVEEYYDYQLSVIF